MLTRKGQFRISWKHHLRVHRPRTAATRREPFTARASGGWCEGAAPGIAGDSFLDQNSHRVEKLMFFPSEAGQCGPDTRFLPSWEGPTPFCVTRNPWERHRENTGLGHWHICSSALHQTTEAHVPRCPLLSLAPCFSGRPLSLLSHILGDQSRAWHLHVASKYCWRSEFRFEVPSMVPIPQSFFLEETT